ncbi:cytosolic endo-beta-N-acetylglucosaminidase 1-like [Chenopodium quinoa]|uniref:mannosyl-glycoprotein endo-beta-N-acetylglucosaminidase n=1 Tax=Chenopodium quinoa TaxID=63459 RepID=A0A803M3Z7_CHEQI|nr:cytosolic endo-beta-N-acetylglucosaminidase 1-like [Chenopodium quinoa]XP_021732538.1 cytosolic endo-beta-N-acetylglucosaminidase 1-like [Chenopodium quinoa]XP_021732539.1 cytosolic endo-beta-N-acetylglucosaminidase 1-like [Chenopodium quinoa]XP_021732540.1 cytosolic endo-beta-N-acetylglucosaminidase 1-like [Chenopodium quinoa]
MLNRLLRAFLKRETLISTKNFVLLIKTKIFLLIPSPIMASQKSPELPISDPPKFDPSQPSNPISYPIKTLQELESRSYFDSFHYPFNKSTTPLNGDLNLPQKPRLLVCHDMAGGYLDDDKWVQGGTNSDAYAIWHWYLMDVFVYFSHNLVTLPPPSWVNAAHKHGVKVLGTFLTEWDEGRIISDQLLSSIEYARMCAERLAELAIALGFDGWLINMEVKINPSEVANLKAFVNHLTDLMHMSKPGSLVIWYDSVTVHGDLAWQDQLNDKNKAFFDLCDGIFVNYTWKKGFPKLSADIAGDRKFDVYMGIDVFGRNTFGGGEWTTNLALDVIRKDDVSAAIFAPGWVYEKKLPPDFQTAQNRWWDLIEKSWEVRQSYPTTIPFYSDFDQGRGHHFSLDGRELSNADWCNLSCQSFQPLLEFSGDPGPDATQVFVNLEEESYNGGGNVTFKGILGSIPYFTKRLFQAKLLLGDPAVGFTYSVKSDGNSLVGISLEFLSCEGEIISVLLASHGDTLLTMNQFSSRFSKVIMPHRITKPESSDGWVVQENIIAMPGYTLTEIRAVCYKLRPEMNEGQTSEYYAVLGHLLIQYSGHNLQFPLSSSWIIEGQDVSWKAGLDESKSVSLTIVWRSKVGDGLNEILKYNIYVKKTSEEDANLDVKLQDVQEFLGVAFVEAFYVSELLVPSGISALKFVIQVCGVDGTCEPLDDSPLFQLNI